MKPAVPRDAIRLTRLTIESVTWFTEKFNLLDGGTEEKLKMGHFIQEDTLEMMVTIADRENLPGGDGIINKGRQVIENEDVFHLLAHIVTPIDKQGMMDALRVSVYSATDLDRFEAKYGTEIKPEKYDDFYNIMCTYRNKFSKKVELLSIHGKKLMPTLVFNKYGEVGMSTYFFEGMAIKDLGEAIWLGVSTEKKNKCSRDFDKFLEYFYERLLAYRDDARKYLVMRRIPSPRAKNESGSDRPAHKREIDRYSSRRPFRGRKMSDDSADIRIADAARVEEYERGYETQVKENELYQDGGPDTEDQYDVDESRDRVSHGPSGDELEHSSAVIGRSTPVAHPHESSTSFPNKHASGYTQGTPQYINRSAGLANVSG